MPAFKHILVPTDFAEPAEQALDLAIELAQKFDAKLTMLHLWPALIPMPYTSGLAWPFEAIEASARRLLDRQVAVARARYPKCEALLQSGIPWEQIVSTAEDLGADLIVMGTHGRRGLSHAVLGSVAERVVRCARIPVLTIGPRRMPRDSDSREQVVLLT